MAYILKNMSFFLFAHIKWMFMLNETLRKVYVKVKKAELF